MASFAYGLMAKLCPNETQLRGLIGYEFPKSKGPSRFRRPEPSP